MIQKNFETQKTFGRKILDENFFGEKYFWSKKSFGQKNVGSKKILCEKNFGQKMSWLIYSGEMLFKSDNRNCWSNYHI